MRCDFEIKDGIYLCQPPYALDLHNDFDFCGLDYSIRDRILSLHWRRSQGDWVSIDTPLSVSVEFRAVSEFRFIPRDAELPFTEDDCVSAFGYWTDEPWAGGVIITGPTQRPEPSWLTAIRFMSGAMVALRAESANARIAS